VIIDDLLMEVRPKLADRVIADVRIGLGYTALLLDDGGCGLSGTVSEGAQGCCTLLAQAGELIDKPALEVAEYAASSDPVASSVGLAMINAVLNRQGEPGLSPLELLPIDNARVGMVGYFEPFIPELRRRSSTLYIFERRPLSKEVLPDWSAERLLPTCDVAIITSLTIINDTLDHLLELAQGEVALVGPTTPLSRTFASHGVSHLFATVVTDPQRIMTIISQAGGTQRFKGSAKKVYLHLKNN
jgi:uncharacterized protein (DUF4213/DUF364 family)